MSHWYSVYKAMNVVPGRLPLFSTVHTFTLANLHTHTTTLGNLCKLNVAKAFEVHIVCKETLLYKATYCGCAFWSFRLLTLNLKVCVSKYL